MPKPIVIYGFHSVQAQLNSHPEYILNAYVLESRTDKRLGNIIKALQLHGISTHKCGKKQLEKLSLSSKNQGIVIEVKLPKLPGHDELIKHIDNLDHAALLLILDSIQDPRNLGACLRSANAFNVDAVIINKDASAPINASTFKTSTGAFNQLNIFAVTNLSRTIKSLQKNGLWVVGLDAGQSSNIQNIDLTSPTALVMGTEGKGIRPLVKSSCDQLVSISMQGSVESLNVSVATGITLYEASKQRFE